MIFIREITRQSDFHNISFEDFIKKNKKKKFYHKIEKEDGYITIEIFNIKDAAHECSLSYFDRKEFKEDLSMAKKKFNIEIK